MAGLPGSEGLGLQDQRGARGADGRAAVVLQRAQQRVERAGDGAGLGGAGGEAGVAAAGAADADQVAAVVGEGAGGVVGVRPGGARRVAGDDRVLDVEGRAGRPRPEDAAAVVGEVGVDGVIQEHQVPVKLAGVDAAAVGAGVVEGPCCR